MLWVGLGGDVGVVRPAGGVRTGAAPDPGANPRRSADLTGLVDELTSYAGPAWTVAEVALVESHLRGAGDRGPRYEPLEFFEPGSLRLSRPRPATT